ncbi:MAG: DUF4342 domain-containing protein [Anaerolineae bacterium]
MADETKEKRTFIEEFKVAGSDLVDRVEELIEQGNVRRLIILNKEGRPLLEIPLTAGVVAGGAVTLVHPVLAALGAMAALLADVTIKVVRVEDEVIPEGNGDSSVAEGDA